MISITITTATSANPAQVVPISSTNTPVSNVLSLTSTDQVQIAFEVTVASVTGTTGIVKLQQSFDGVNFSDVDATNMKVTITGAGRFALSLSPYVSAIAAKFPLWPFIRFVATTTASDAFTVSKILVTSTRP